MGPLGQHQKWSHGYFSFPKLEGEIHPHMNFRGKEHLVWSLNNYLGLANHPEVRKADADAAAGIAPVRPAEMTPEQIEEYRNRGTFLKQGVFISEDGRTKTTFKDGLVTNVEYDVKPMHPPSLAELNKNGPQRATEADLEHQNISPDGTKPYIPPEERATTTTASTEPTAPAKVAPTPPQEEETRTPAIPSTRAQPPEQAPISAAAQRQNALNQSRANDAAGISNIVSEPENP